LTVDMGPGAGASERRVATAIVGFCRTPRGPSPTMILAMEPKPNTLTALRRALSKRRPYWILGHEIMGVAVICYVIAQIQYSAAPPDDNFLAGFTMIVYGTFALMVGLLVYAATGLAALIAAIRKGRRRRRDGLSRSPV
jgi:hypothetical protein